MNKYTRKILGGTLVLMARVVFVGLLLWGFLLYTRNEWVMW